MSRQAVWPEVARLRFASFVLDTDRRVLEKMGTPVAVEPKVYLCLELLVRRAGKLVTREELTQAIWPDVKVCGDSLRQVVFGARRALGERAGRPSLITNRKRLGYVLAASVQLERDANMQPAAAWPLVGRDAELSSLRSVVGAMARGSGGLCLVSGEAGSGKSTLLSELRREYAGTRWLVTGCQPHAGTPAFWPWRACARELARLPGVAERDAAQLLAAAAELARTRAAESELDAEARFVACDQFATALVRSASSAPLVLVVEDLHWADDGSLILLEVLGQAVRERAVAVFATYRPHEVAPGTLLSGCIARLSGRQGTLVVGVPALSLHEVFDLLTRLQHPAATESGAQRVRALTGGNALFVKHVIEHEQTRQGRPVVSPDWGLQHVVAARIENLPAPTRELLAVAAVLGAECDLELLADVAQIDASSVAAGVELLVVSGLIERRREEGQVLRFSHALLREVLYASLSDAWRCACHARAFDAWCKLAPSTERSLALATHAFLAADQLPLPLRCRLCEEAGRNALAGLAFDQAALQLGRAVALSEAAPLQRRAELALLHARALCAADHPAVETQAAFRRAAELARGAGDSQLFAQAAIGCAVGEESVANLGSARWRSDDVGLLQLALRALEATPPTESRAWLEHRVARTLASMRLSMGDYAAAQQDAERALRVMPARGDAWTCLYAVTLRHFLEVWSDGAEAGSAASSRELAACAVDRRLRPWQRVEGAAVLMDVQLSTGNLVGYVRARERMAQLTAAMPDPPPFGRAGERQSHYAWMPALAEVTLLILQGRFDEADALNLRLLRAAEQSGRPQTRAMREMQFLLRLQTRSYQALASTLEPELDERLRSFPEDAWQLSIAKAQIALELGDMERARRYFAIVRSTEFQVPVAGRLTRAPGEARVRMVDLCIALGDAADAALLYASCAASNHYTSDRGLLCYGSSARPIGALACKLGKFEEAERRFSCAIEMNRRLNHRPELRRSRLGLASLLQQLGRERDAERQLLAIEHEARETARKRAPRTLASAPTDAALANR